jgi:hypothetical protein
MRGLQHLLRYGTSTDKKYFQEYQQFASTIVFNANTICHQSRDNAELLYVDLSDKEYVIDPRTYAYQMDLKYLTRQDGKGIKQTYQSLLSEYKLPSTLLENDNPINNNNIQILDETNFVDNVLNFQENYLFDNLEDDLKILVRRSRKNKSPKFLIAPYFLLRDEFDFWLNVNNKLLEESLEKKVKYQKEIYAILLITKEILVNEALINEILEVYSKADGLIFWVNEYNEQTVTETEIMGLIKLVSSYKEKNPQKEIISLYGGYFSQLLYHIGLDGVCHNLVYGEHRSLNPIGAQPTHKYYLPSIKRKIDPFDMLNILKNHKLKTKEEFYDKICSCKVCKKNINTDKIEEKFIVYLHDKDPDRTIELSRDNCIRHYLECKVQEFQEIPNQGFEIIIQELKSTYDTFLGKGYLANTKNVNIEYLKRWHNSLADSIKII